MGLRSERGAGVNLWTMCMVFIVVACAGIAVDLVGAVYAQSRAIDFAGQAARVGANQIDLAGLQACEWTLRVDPVMASQAVGAYISEIEGFSLEQAKVTGASVQVRVGSRWDPVFLSMFGIRQIPVTGQADANARSVVASGEISPTITNC
ncbi:MAG: hypothetical protein LBI99_08760 [Propionibacteriaceae bacterium]|jgi:hypothetical protein|nr:hypothetical protein [Propionibacteriaceae bacterium]